MMDDHIRCPECESYKTEDVYTEWYSDAVEKTIICNNCPTEWIVAFGDPIVRDVRTFDQDGDGDD